LKIIGTPTAGISKCSACGYKALIAQDEDDDDDDDYGAPAGIWGGTVTIGGQAVINNQVYGPGTYKTAADGSLIKID